ncbi:ATP-binding protein [Pasteurellaceae bacterium Macca]|nr:ATP-binding protein [Pasteurellaceae bacterium Macca]
MKQQLMTKQDQEKIFQTAFSSIEQGKQLLNKSYLAELGNRSLQLLMGYPEEKINIAADIRLFQIERVVLENKQSVLESLTATYTALGAARYSVFLLLNSDGKETIIYLGVKGKPKSVQGRDAGILLEQAFKGHFTGSQLSPISLEKTEKLLFSLRNTDINIKPCITSVTGVPALSVEEREHFVQGLEHFIDAAEGQKYQALILAEPVSPQQLELIRTGYEGIATQLSPLLKQSFSYGENENESVGLSLSKSINQSFSKSLSLTETKGINESTNRSSTQTDGRSFSTTESTTYNSSINIGNTIGTALGLFGSIGGKGVSIGTSKSSSNQISQGLSFGISKGKTSSIGTSLSNSETSGLTQGTSTSYSKGSSESKTDSYGISIGETNSQSIGSNKQITLETINKTIEQLLQRVDHQLERVDEARRYGGWNSAAYFICDNSAASNSLASIFLGLMRGNNSNSEDFALTTWRNDQAVQVSSWLANLSHPKVNAELAKEIGISYFTPATLVSGKEMAMQLSLPRRSTSTVSVVETPTFGRRIQWLDGKNYQIENSIHLGQIRHLWNDLPQNVDLNVNQLTSHLFVSGSTGSGKSNTIYQILSELRKREIPFMVIEPAKGEYKNVFGHFENVSVFGTNPQHTELLKINPFKFPKEVHILEHIDRLVEIFNVCWPMYAAMPAVLKDAILNAYQRSGWDLTSSKNKYDEALFPSFSDLLYSLENVINESAYSQEMKSNYIGSLVTRVKSLTNGLNGEVFNADEIDNAILFDSNVIIDLSRIGSQETKSLIMGILIMRLNEHRMRLSEMNQPLKHVTVLEEAHNILKRTSTEQSSEGSNILGKSVEMLSNAIAEMRTYGQGFIIVDQSPSAVDISAIRNTNTKIIMRLPDETDRRLVGKAADVSDEQLEEIAKLPKGVAVVYQNDWLEPVLCKINHANVQETLYKVKATTNFELERKKFNTELARFIFAKKMGYIKEFDFKLLKEGVKKFPIATDYKHHLLMALNKAERSGNFYIWNQNVDLSNLLISILNFNNELYKKNSEELSREQYLDHIKIKLHENLLDNPSELQNIIYSQIKLS